MLHGGFVESRATKPAPRIGFVGLAPTILALALVAEAGWLACTAPSTKQAWPWAWPPNHPAAPAAAKRKCQLGGSPPRPVPDFNPGSIPVVTLRLAPA